MIDIDKKIKTILKELREAHTESEKFYIKQSIQGEPTISTDIYEMALAFNREEKILLELDLAYGEKFTDLYSDEHIWGIKKEIESLSFRIRAWEHKKFPCEYKE